MSCLPLKKRRKRKKNDDYYEYSLGKVSEHAILKNQRISWPFKNNKEINFLKHHGIFYEHGMYPAQKSAIATTVVAEKRPKGASSDSKILVHVKVFNRLRGSLLDKTDIETMAKHMNNPNLVLPLKVLITRDDKFLLVSDFCEGDQINTYMRRHSFKPDVAKDLFRQIISCMNYCHLEGYVHFNLTPVSILVKEGSEPLVQITDFAIPAMTDIRRMEQLYGRTCCYSYEAPEVLQIEEIESKTWATTDRSNVFSLGVILYEMLTGSPPFLGEPTQLLEKVSSDMNFNKKIPAKAKDLLTKMLKPQPHLRPSAFVCLHHPWLCSNNIEILKKDSDNLWERLPQHGLPECPWSDKVKEEKDMPKSSPIKKELDSVWAEYCERSDRRQCGLQERPWSDMVKEEKVLVGDALKKQEHASPFMTSKKVTMCNASTQTLSNASTQTGPVPEEVLREDNNQNDTQHRNQTSVIHLTDEALRKRREFFAQNFGIDFTIDIEDTQVYGTQTRVTSPKELESQNVEPLIAEKVVTCYKEQDLEAVAHSVSGSGHSVYGKSQAKESGSSQCAVERETKKSNPRDVKMTTDGKKSKDMQELPDMMKKKSVDRHCQTAEDVKVAKLPCNKDDRKTETKDIPSDRDPSLPDESSTLVSCVSNQAPNNFAIQNSTVWERSTHYRPKMYQSDPTTPTPEADDKFNPKSSEARRRHREQTKELEAKKHQSAPTSNAADNYKLEGTRHHHEDRIEVEGKFYQGELSAFAVDVDEELNSDSLNGRKRHSKHRKELNAKNHQSQPNAPTVHVEDKSNFTSSETRRHHCKVKEELKAPTTPSNEMDDKLSSVSLEARRHHHEKSEEFEAKKHQSDPNAPTVHVEDEFHLTSSKARRSHQKDRKELAERNAQSDPITPTNEMIDKLSSVSSEARRRHREKREKFEAKKQQNDPSAPTIDVDDKLNLTSSKAGRLHQKNRKELAERNPQCETTPIDEMDDKLSSDSSETRRHHREHRRAKMHRRDLSLTSTQDDEEVSSTTLEAKRHLQEDRKELEGKDILMQTKEERCTTGHEKLEGKRQTQETLKPIHPHIEKAARQEHLEISNTDFESHGGMENGIGKEKTGPKMSAQILGIQSDNEEEYPTFASNKASDTESDCSAPSFSSYSSTSEGSPFEDVNQRNDTTSTPLNGQLSKPTEDLVEVCEQKSDQKEKVKYENNYLTLSKRIIKKRAKLEKKAKKEEKRQQKEQKKSEKMKEKERKRELKKEEKRAKKLAKTNLKKKQCSAEAMEGTVKQGEAIIKRLTEIQANNDTSKENAERVNLNGDIDNKTENLQPPIDTPVTNAVAQKPQESNCEQCPKDYKTSKKEKKLAKKEKKLQKKIKREEKRQNKKAQKAVKDKKEILTKEMKKQMDEEKQAEKAGKQDTKVVMNDTANAASDSKSHVTNGEDMEDSRTALTDEEKVQQEADKSINEAFKEDKDIASKEEVTAKEAEEKKALKKEAKKMKEAQKMEEKAMNAEIKAKEATAAKESKALKKETKKMKEAQKKMDKRTKEEAKEKKALTKEAKKMKEAQKKMDKRTKEEAKEKEAKEKKALKKEAKKMKEAQKEEDKKAKLELKAKQAEEEKEKKKIKDAAKEEGKKVCKEMRAKQAAAAKEKKALKKEAKKELKKSKKKLKKDKDHVPSISADITYLNFTRKDDPEDKPNAENQEAKTNIVEEEKSSKDVVSKPVVVTSQDRLLEATIAAYHAKCGHEYTRTPVMPFVAEDSDSEDEIAEPKRKVIHQKKPPEKPALAWT